MTTLHRLAALWVGRTHWFISGVSPADPFPFTLSDRWRKEPTVDARIEQLLKWSVELACGVETASYRQLGTRVHVQQPRDSDGVLRYAVIISPEVGALMGAAAPAPGAPHPWRARLEEAGWTVRTRDPDPTRPTPVWLTVERPAHRPEVEIGILMAGWCDPTNLEELATHGLVRGGNGRVDPWGSCYTHGEFRRLTGWPLSAGAGMAAIKGLKRSARTSKIYWAPRPEQWLEIPVMREGRPHARPWHLQWVTPKLPYLGDVVPEGEVALWDANADYLSAWSSARFARGMLKHTGPDPARMANRRAHTGWYLIGDLCWDPRAQHVADQLPPVWGSRTPDPDGHVWVTHVTLDLIDSLTFAPDHAAPTYIVYDSWTCTDSGQLAKPWGETLKKALITAKTEHAERPDDCTPVLVSVLKQTYVRGYPLLETSGLIRRPDHVDTVIDQRFLSAYLRMWKQARDCGRYPLQISADEITYLWRAGDEQEGPLGRPDPFAYGAYKVKNRGTVADWAAALQDGRRGRWWIPRPDQAPQPAQDTPTALPPPPQSDGDGAWYRRFFTD